MFSRTILRRVPRQPAKVVARFESTSSKASEAAAKATEKAKEFQSKAAEGLSRVSSAAGPAITGAARSVSKALGGVGGRTGKVIQFFQRQIPPTIYYTKVGFELGKLVFKGQKMTPPPLETFQAYFQQAVKVLRHPNTILKTTQDLASSPQTVLQRARNLSREQMAYGAVVGAEVLGFFTVGEMLGRMKIVGYRGDVGGHH